ncbi:MAG: Hsp20 family protein [Gammaproteobacteria bacterium]|nr:Hsp20 family protein [Gammaproteobacteria bacterium]
MGLTPFDDMDRYFADLEQNIFNRGWFRPSWLSTSMTGTMPFEGRMPRVDVVDRDEDVLVRAELPGVEKKDLDINASDHTITLSAKCAHEEKQEKGDYFRHEIGSGSFSRTITLPAGVNIDKARATFKDGILELVLPKLEKTSRKRIVVD